MFDKTNLANVLKGHQLGDFVMADMLQLGDGTSEADNYGCEPVYSGYGQPGHYKDFRDCVASRRAAAQGGNGNGGWSDDVNKLLATGGGIAASILNALKGNSQPAPSTGQAPPTGQTQPKDNTLLYVGAAVVGAGFLYAVTRK